MAAAADSITASKTSPTDTSTFLFPVRLPGFFAPLIPIPGSPTRGFDFRLNRCPLTTILHYPEDLCQHISPCQGLSETFY
jgi:hypothetical protein